jgi:hypothetical protein
MPLSSQLTIENHHRAEEGRPEPGYAEVQDEPGDNPQADRVDDEDEEPERQQLERQRQDDEQRADDRVHEPEHDAGDESRRRVRDLQPRNELGGDQDGDAVDDQADQKAHGAGF